MRSPDSTRSPVTRRAVLGTVAAGISAGTATATQSTAVTVMTQNAYVGFDVAALAGADSLDDVRRIAEGFRERLDPELYAARADRIAASIAASGADVVALQEAVAIRRQQPGDFDTDSNEPAAELVVDLREEIRSALARRGLDYVVAAETVPGEFELPAGTAESPVDLRITDRNVLLVREGLDTDDPETATYDAALRFPIPESDRYLTVQRGYSGVDVTVEGSTVRVVSVHLESISERFRRRQAGELLDALPAGPVVVCGDFNSAPGQPAYNRLTRSLTDAHAELRPDEDGYTCCQAKTLRNDQSRLSRRIDALLYRGVISPTAIGRVGHRPEDRAEVELDGETVRVWPSDHAGVVGTFDISSAPAATTPSRTATGSPPNATAPSTTTGASGPGVGAFPAAAALAVGAWLRRRTQ